MLATALVATACSGGARPTLTTDQIPITTDEGTIDESALGDSVDLDQFDDDAFDDDEFLEDSTTGDESLGSEPATVESEVQQLSVEVLDTFPHDEDAFTQGLELQDGVLVESTGLYGESDLRRVEVTTGEVLEVVSVSDEFFAEGLTRVGNELIQITWRENTALFYDINTFEVTRQASYDGEGWGLCFDGLDLIMTDGTPYLIFRDAVTFEETSRLPVTLNGEDVFNLNEIECVDGQVWANIWQTSQIVRIDPVSGEVNAVVDAQELVQIAGVGDDGNAVLNGIAWDADTGTFLVTGKLWPLLFRVNFVPAS